MFRYIIRRLFQAIPTLFGISIISFALVSAAPGDPVMKRTFDPNIKAEDREILRRQLGLDQSPVIQYITWFTGIALRAGDHVAELINAKTRCTYGQAINVTFCDKGGGILRGDLGTSFNTKEPVWERLIQKMPATLELGIASLMLSIVVGVPLGVLAAVYRGSPFDYLVRFLSSVFQSIPIFWVGLMMILVFAVVLGLLPSNGRQTATLNQEFDLLDRLRHLILPSFTLAIGGIAGFSRIMRTETLEVLHTDYIRTARAKGLAPTNVWFLHALRNALIPLMTILGPAIVGVLSGALVTETVFGWPGMGRMTVAAVGQNDYPMVLGAGMFFAALTIIGNLLSDIFYGIVDPRVRLG
jgi:peptide/nickel transport system permease protein